MCLLDLFLFFIELSVVSVLQQSEETAFNFKYVEREILQVARDI